MTVTSKQLNYAYGTYTDDLGNHFSVKMDVHWLLHAAALFSAFDPANPCLPDGFKMRQVRLVDPATGRRISRPVGAIDADLWTLTATSAPIPVLGLEDEVTYQVTAKIGEVSRVPHAIFNAPDTTGAA